MKSSGAKYGVTFLSSKDNFSCFLQLVVLKPIATEYVGIATEYVGIATEYVGIATEYVGIVHT